jgi:exodeoxyribonuclease VII large subunit
VANQSFKTPTAVAEDIVARFVQMRRKLDESASGLKSVWAYRLKIDQDYIARAITGIHQGTRKLLDVATGRLRELAQNLRHRVQGRMATEQVMIETKRGQLRSLPIVMVQRHAERLGSKGQTLASSTRFVLKVKTMQLKTMRDRFRMEKIQQRITIARKSLNEKMATIRAFDPQNALKRGYALVYQGDGVLVRSIHDVAENDTLYTHLADGSIVSQVKAKETERG